MKQLRILGQIVFVDAAARTLPLTRGNQRKLLAVMACHYGHPVPTDRLLESLGLSRGGLRTRVRRVRQIVGDDAIVTESTGYRLGDVSTDAEVFLRLRTQAAVAPGDEGIALLQQACSLWTGNALEEFAAEPWAAGEAARLDELRAATIDDLAELLIALDRPEEATAELERQVALNPFRDRSRRLLMRALHRCGRTAEALRAFQDYRTLLIDETGTEPPAGTAALERRIVAGEAGDDSAPPARAAPAATPSPADLVGSVPVGSVTPVTPVTPVPPANQAASARMAPAASLPGDTALGHTALGDTAPGDTVPADRTPGDSLPGDTAPAASLPGDTALGDTAPHSLPASERPALLTFLYLQLEPNQSPWDRTTELRPESKHRYDELFAELTVASAGTLVDSNRDSLVVVFNNPIDCIRAAVQVLRSRHDADGVSGTVPVRIGVHTGMGFGEGGTYYRPTLDRSAAVMQAANSGQILLSASTATFVDVASGIESVHRGRHRLVDLPEPIDLFEVIWSESVGGLRPLRTVSDIPTNVPAVRSELVGRDADLESLHELLADNRIVTLIGPGGAGKSALAVELAAAHTADFVDGVFVAELASVTRSDLVADAIATAVTLRAEGVRHTPRTLALALRSRSMLIVIDNAEHVLDEVAAVVDELMCYEGPSVVVTSREWLDVPGEQTLHVPTLSANGPSGVSHGAQLFISNASLAGVPISESEIPAVEELCARLDHLPLAIELAAGSVRHLAPREIVAALDRGEALAASRRRHRTRRFTSLDQMTQRSYELLDERQQSLLRTLGVFRGPIALDAITGVWDSPFVRQTNGLVGSLVSRSLVVAKASRGTVRYELLETIRDFARDRANECGELEALQRAHRDWFLSWSRTTSHLELYGSIRRAARLDSQLADFRAAMTYSQQADEPELAAEQARLLTNVWYTFLRGDEGADWLRASGHAVSGDHERLAHLTCSMACAFASADAPGVLSIVGELHALAERVDSPLSPLALAMVALVASGGPEVSEAQFAEARRRDDELRAGLRPLIEHLNGDLYIRMGDFPRALECYRKVPSLLQPEEFAWWVSSALVGSAVSLHGTGRTAEALPLAERSSELAGAMPESLGGLTRSLSVVSVLRSALGDFDRATAGLYRAMERNERLTRSSRARLEPIVAVIHVLLDRGERGVAQRLLRLADEHEVAHHSPWQSALFRLGAARPEAAGWRDTEVLSIDEAVARSIESLRPPSAALLPLR